MTDCILFPDGTKQLLNERRRWFETHPTYRLRPLDFARVTWWQARATALFRCSCCCCCLPFPTLWSSLQFARCTISTDRCLKVRNDVAMRLDYLEKPPYYSYFAHACCLACFWLTPLFFTVTAPFFPVPAWRRWAEAHRCRPALDMPSTSFRGCKNFQNVYGRRAMRCDVDDDMRWHR